jgi:hypothetical protein
MPSLLMRRAVMPPSAHATAFFDRIIFAGENRYNDQQGFRGDPA